MKSKNKHVLIVGDRVLIEPSQDNETSKGGLYLPASVIEKQEVRRGTIVEVGPGIPVGSIQEHDDEPWKQEIKEVKYIPTQAEIGDDVLYLSKAGIEINLDKNKYIIVAQSAILVLIRNDLNNLIS